MAFWVAVVDGYSSDVKNNIHEQQGQDMALWGTRKWWAYDDEQDYLIAVSNHNKIEITGTEWDQRLFH